MELTLEEIIDIFNKRELNSKCNNYIITDLNTLARQVLIECIKKEIIVKKVDANLIEESDVVMNNILVDLKMVAVKDLLSYLLECLNIPRSIDFKDKFDLLKYRGFLRDYNKYSSIILYNSENLMDSERMLLNEIYGFNTNFFNVNDLTTEGSLRTYQTSSSLFLDGREDYTRIRLLK